MPLVSSPVAGQPDRVKRLDLSGLELLIEGAVIETRRSLARLNEPFH